MGLFCGAQKQPKIPYYGYISLPSFQLKIVTSGNKHFVAYRDISWMWNKLVHSWRPVMCAWSLGNSQGKKFHNLSKKEHSNVKYMLGLWMRETAWNNTLHTVTDWSYVYKIKDKCHTQTHIECEYKAVIYKEEKWWPITPSTSEIYFL